MNPLTAIVPAIIRVWKIVSVDFNDDTRCVVASAPELEGHREEPRYEILQANVCRYMRTEARGAQAAIEYLRPLCVAYPAGIGDGHIVCMVPPGKSMHGPGPSAGPREPWENAEQRGEWTPKPGDVLQVKLLDYRTIPTVEKWIASAMSDLQGMVTQVLQQVQEAQGQEARASAAERVGEAIEAHLIMIDRKLDSLAAAARAGRR